MTKKYSFESEEILWDIIDNTLKDFINEYYLNTKKLDTLNLKINKDNGEISLYSIKKVDLKARGKNGISIEEAKKYDKKATMGDEIKIEEFEGENKEKINKFLIKQLKKEIKKIKQKILKGRISGMVSQTLKVKLTGRAENNKDWLLECEKIKIKQYNKELDIDDYKGFTGVLTQKEIPIVDKHNFQKGKEYYVYYNDLEIDENFKYNYGLKPSFQLNSDNHVREVLKNNVPKIQTGQISIKRVQRFTTKFAKVAIKNEGLKEDENMLKLVGKHLKKVSKKLNGEKIALVIWDEDFRKLAFNSIVSMKGRKINCDWIKVENEGVNFENIKFDNKNNEFKVDNKNISLRNIKLKIKISDLGSKRKTGQAVRKLIGEKIYYEKANGDKETPSLNIAVSKNFLGVANIKYISKYN